MLPSVKAKKHYERSSKPCEIWWGVNVGIACEGNIISSGHLLTCLLDAFERATINGTTYSKMPEYIRQSLQRFCTRMPT